VNLADEVHAPVEEDGFVVVMKGGVSMRRREKDDDSVE
jgi:hypothetical protein